MLAKEGVGKRSGIRPFFGFAVSQKKRKVRASTSIRTGSTTGLVRGGAVYRRTISKRSPARLDVKIRSSTAANAISVTVRLARKMRIDVYKQVARRNEPATLARAVAAWLTPLPTPVRIKRCKEARNTKTRDGLRRKLR